MPDNNPDDTETDSNDFTIPTLDTQTLVFAAIVILAVAGILYVQLGGTSTPKQPQGQSNQEDTTTNPNTVLAVVNGVEITAQQVSQIQQSAGPRQNMTQKQALEQAVNQQLLTQAAQRAGYELSSSEVDAAIRSRLERRNMTLAEYKRQLQQQGQSYTKLRERAGDQLAVRRYVRANIGNVSMNVTDSMARQYYQRISQQGQQVPPFDQVKERIKQRIRQQQQQRAIRRLVQQLRSQANITYK